MTETAQRAAVVDEAREWLGTPYHHMGRVKGRAGGVDCAMLLAEVYERAGLIDHIEVQHYPRDWHLHRRDERFVGYILPRAVEIPGPPKRGDVVTYAIGLGFAHAAIVNEPGWPAIIHSDMDARRVTLADGTRGRHAVQKDGTLRPTRFFTLWPDSAS
nr:hydrolase [uncultured Rhodopila sp.]